MRRSWGDVVAASVQAVQIGERFDVLAWAVESTERTLLDSATAARLHSARLEMALAGHPVPLRGGVAAASVFLCTPGTRKLNAPTLRAADASQ